MRPPKKNPAFGLKEKGQKSTLARIYNFLGHIKNWFEETKMSASIRTHKNSSLHHIMEN